MSTETSPQHIVNTGPSGGASMIGPQRPASIGPARTAQSPMPLELMELEFALDLNDIAERGFSDAVRAAAKTIDAEFLFDLPASGLVDNAQRIAIVCLSRNDGGRFGLVLLAPDGDRASTLEPGPETADLVQFARAFVAVLEKL
jgi:hypothetical protein